MMGQICFNDLVELLLCSEKLVLNLIFPDAFRCILTLPSFFMPKYAADVHEAERTCN